MKLTEENMKLLMNARNHGAGTNSSSPCSTVNGISCLVKKKYYPCGNIILNCVCLEENFCYGIEKIKNKYK